MAFDPSEDPRAFRNALGRFATGVTVVTAPGPVGITANSFASLSLDPPLVLWSPARSSRRFDAFVQAASFAVHVIGEERQTVAEAFVRDGAAFDGLDWCEDAEGVPLIAGCLARFRCRTHAVHEGGDHAIVVGEVTEVETTEGAPLVFAGGAYGVFTAA
ncbi:MAG: flavin reductase family protein [Shimia sp.]